MVRATGLSYAAESIDTFGRDNASTLNAGRPALAHSVVAGIRRIVVPLDGSRSAEHALPHAIAFARRTGASVHLVHVFSLLEAFSPWGQSYHRGVSDHYRSEKYAYMNTVARRVRAALGGYVSGVVISERDVAGAISSLSNPTTLVVMATRNRGFLKKLLRGSVTDDLIGRLNGPLLLVRGSSSRPDLSSDPMPRRILIPLNGTTCAERAMVPALQLGALGGARYSLVHLRDAGRLVDRSELAAASAYLKDVASRSPARASSVEAEVLVSERDAATDLLDFAANVGADWVVLTAHTRPIWGRLLRRSLAKSVVRRASMPLLIVRHAAEREEECEQVLGEAARRLA